MRVISAPCFMKRLLCQPIRKGPHHIHKSSLHPFRSRRLLLQIAPQGRMEPVNIVPHMGAEAGVFQNFKAGLCRLRRYRFLRCGQHLSHQVCICIVFVQAGHLQNGEEPGFEALPEDGVGRLEAAGAFVPLLPLKGAVQAP